LGTALVSTLGAASVAEAVTATMSGNHQTGLEFDSPTGGTDTRAQINDNNFTVSLSETTDGGVTISSSFMLMNEAGGGSSDEDAGFSFAFSDGSSLDVLNAGNASGSHDISVPASAGSEGVTITTSNKAPTGLDFTTASTVYGVEYHTAADFLVDGLSMSVSASTDDGSNNASTYALDGHFAVGYADGDDIVSQATTSSLNTEVDGEVIKAGVKYVTGDLTFNVGVTAGEGKDSHTLGTAGTTDDSYDKTSASVSYAVASGVTAYLGYSDVDSSNEGVNDTTDGSSWYIGANMSF
jgi:hypothetical protein